MTIQKRRKSLRSLDTGPIVDLHIGIPIKVLNMLDELKDDLHVSRSVIIRQLITQEYENE